MEALGLSAQDVKARLRVAVHHIYRSQLKAISLIIAAYYGLISFAHFFFLTADLKIYMMPLSITAFLYAVGLYYIVTHRYLPPHYSHLSFLPLGALGIINSYVHVFLTQDLLQLTNGILLIFAFSVVTLSPWAFAFLSLLGTIAYWWLLIGIGGEYVAHFSFMYVATIMVSVLTFWQRSNTIWKMERLLIFNRKKNEKLNALNRTIEQQVEEARQAEEKAREANEAKDVFLANTSHELRTPMTGVLGMMTVLEKSDLSAEQREVLTAAQQSASTLLAIINDILDLAKMDAGQLKIKEQPFRFREVLTNIIELLRPSAEEKGLKYVLNMPEEAAFILEGDPIRFGQVLFNVVGNAIKFTEKGSVTITVHAEQEAGLCEVSVIVADTGIGFSPEKKDHLFTRFGQADETSMRQQSGTGLGLAICRQLMTLMNGTIEAESKPGKGSVFKIDVTLPIVEEDMTEHETSTTHEQQHTLHDMHLLVAEDNPVNQILIQKLFAPYGCKLTLVQNGQLAVDAVAKSDEFDLILMDVRMPVMDGVAATKAIRQLDVPHRHTPIIALTANTMEQDQQAYLKVGMNAVVGKPIDVNELMRTISDLLPERV